PHMGFRIDVSPEHPVLVADDGPPRFVQAGAVLPRQYACRSRVVTDSSEPVMLPLAEWNGHIVAGLPTSLDEGLAWWLGATVGDGSYRDRRDGTIELTNADPEVLDAYRCILEGYGLRVGCYRSPGRRVSRLYVCSKAFRSWLETLGLRYAT